MKIPTQLVGHWKGEITDSTRKKPYDGEIILRADGVSATYFMAQGPMKGNLSLECVSDGFLMLKETAGSFDGTLLLYLDADSNLKCVWRNGSFFSSEATMIRVQAVTQ